MTPSFLQCGRDLAYNPVGSMTKQELASWISYHHGLSHEVKDKVISFLQNIWTGQDMEICWESSCQGIGALSSLW